MPLAVRVCRQVVVAVGLLAIAVFVWEGIKLVTNTGDRTMPHLWDIVAFLGSRRPSGRPTGRCC